MLLFPFECLTSNRDLDDQRNHIIFDWTYTIFWKRDNRLSDFKCRTFFESCQLIKHGVGFDCRCAALNETGWKRVAGLNSKLEAIKTRLELLLCFFKLRMNFRPQFHIFFIYIIYSWLSMNNRYNNVSQLTTKAAYTSQYHRRVYTQSDNY